MNQSPDLLRRLLRAKDRMDGAPQEAWPVQRLAQVSAVSEAYFSRQFRLAFGLPPHRYLLTRRIERAVALCRDTALPITEIAYQTGWNSLGTFGRIFHDITGLSPGEVRTQGRGAARQARVRECFVRASGRPDLDSAVSEKRRRTAAGTKKPSTTEVA